MGLSAYHGKNPMRSYDPTDDYDIKELARLNAAPWMLPLLSLNPEYVHWGPGEDYMATGPKDSGWNASQEIESWSKFGPWGLDELNEIVHFYFQITRKKHTCEDCDGGGYNPATRKISEDFYGFEDSRTRWIDKITQDELDVLIAKKRIRGGATLDEVNTANGSWTGKVDFNKGVIRHDAINKHILVQQRATRLGVYGLCSSCEGHGYVFDEPEAKLGLVLWFLHPRKGASRGVSIHEVTEADLPEVCDYLAEAAKRNAERFAKVVRESKNLRKKIKNAG